jgi:hypothetical protein
MMQSMTKRRRTATEQKFWDEIFARRFDRCMDQQQQERDPIGCARLAADQTDVALAVRRRSLKEHP